MLPSSFPVAIPMIAILIAVASVYSASAIDVVAQSPYSLFRTLFQLLLLPLPLTLLLLLLLSLPPPLPLSLQLPPPLLLPRPLSLLLLFLLAPTPTPSPTLSSTTTLLPLPLLLPLLLSRLLPFSAKTATAVGSRVHMMFQILFGLAHIVNPH